VGFTILSWDMTERNLINKLDRISVGGVFRLYNPLTQKVYINASKNILYFVSKLMMDIKQGLFHYKEMEGDYELLKLEILEVVDDIETCREHLQYWVDKHIQEGWVLYNARKKPEARTPKVVLLPEKGVIEVRLINRRRDYKVVGVFSKLEEAEEFLKECYCPVTNSYNYTVFCTNSLTRERVNRNIKQINYRI
jgi:hypothetical protein